MINISISWKCAAQTLEPIAFTRPTVVLKNSATLNKTELPKFLPILESLFLQKSLRLTEAFDAFFAI